MDAKANPMQIAIAINKASNNFIAPVNILSINISLKEFVKSKPEINIIIIPILICSLDNSLPIRSAREDKIAIVKPQALITTNLLIFTFLREVSTNRIIIDISPATKESLREKKKNIQNPRPM